MRSDDAGKTWNQLQWQPVIRVNYYEGKTYSEYLSEIFSCDSTLYCIVQGVDPYTIIGNSPFVQSAFGSVQGDNGYAHFYTDYPGGTASGIYHNKESYFCYVWHVSPVLFYCNKDTCFSKESPLLHQIVNLDSSYVGIDRNNIYRKLEKFDFTTNVSELPGNLKPIQIVSNERNLLCVLSKRNGIPVFFYSTDTAVTWIEFMVSNPITVKSIHFFNGVLMLLRNDLPCSILSIEQPVVPRYTLQLYPNPISNTLYINLPDVGSDPISFSISSMNGERVYQHDNTMKAGEYISVDTRSFPQGMYVIHVQYPDRVETRTVLKIE